MKKITRVKLILVVLVLTPLVIFGVSSVVRADLITFSADTPGAKANGYMSPESGNVSFTDSVGSALEVGDYGGQSIGQALAVYSDLDGSVLKMAFSGLNTALSLDFGNDDPGYTNPGDLAMLTLFNGVTQVGQVSVVMNRDDIMNQTISYSGAAFDNATFAYTDPAGNPFTGGGAGLTEVVDNIAFNNTAAVPIPEPTAILFLVTGLAGLLGTARYRRRQPLNDPTFDRSGEADASPLFFDYFPPVDPPGVATRFRSQIARRA